MSSLISFQHPEILVILKVPDNHQLVQSHQLFVIAFRGRTIVQFLLADSADWWLLFILFVTFM